MTRILRAQIFIAVAAFSLGSVAQSKAPAARDSEAVTIVSLAIERLGGLERAASVTTAVVEGELHAPPGSTSPPVSFNWVDDWSSEKPRFRRVKQTAKGEVVLVSGDRGASSSLGTKGHRIQEHVAYSFKPYHLPALLLAQILRDEAKELRMAGTCTEGANAGVLVRISSDASLMSKELDQQEWCFDALTHRPLRVTLRLPDPLNAIKSRPATATYSDFRLVEGMLVPFEIATTSEGKQHKTVKLTQVEFNLPQPTHLFDSLELE